MKETAEASSTRNHPGFIGRPCDGGCGHTFVRGDRFTIVETQVSWFRGDDDVKAFCVQCRPIIEKAKGEKR